MCNRSPNVASALASDATFGDRARHEPTIRVQLQHAALRLSHGMQWFATFKQTFLENGAYEQALDIIERYAEGSLNLQPLRRIRKRIGRAHFPTFLCLLLELAIETDNEITTSYDEHERLLNLRILALGLGLEKHFVQKKDDYPRWHINLQEIFLSLPTDDQALVLVSWLALSQ